jgi:hypothetical protein
MDGYPTPIADLFIDAAAGHQIISFTDGNAGYNQIFLRLLLDVQVMWGCLNG